MTNSWLSEATTRSCSAASAGTPGSSPLSSRPFILPSSSERYSSRFSSAAFSLSARSSFSDWYVRAASRALPNFSFSLASLALTVSFSWASTATA